jgi:hypothetical protein
MKSAPTNTHTHKLVFTGMVPGDEADRAMIHASPNVVEAKAKLLTALADAGHPHTLTTEIKAPRKARAPKLATAAE